jgi:predicted RNA-binding Zn ribbon-like protein
MSASGFRFYLGSPALNFSATLGFRAAESVERIPTPDALGAWLAEAGLAAGVRPTEAEHRDARDLREAIFRVGEAIDAGTPVPAADVATINAAARGGLPAAQLDPRTLEAHTISPQPVRSALAAIAADAIAVFAHERARLGRCEGIACGALMLSSARGAKRRWCSMTSCGNRAKVAAYRARRS